MWQNGTLQLASTEPVITLANPTASRKPAYHSTEAGPLFPNRPWRTDINQGVIGNCYALAAINSVVTRPSGPDVIMGAMLDNGMGRVIVRLYIDGEWRHYSVEKSVYRRRGFAKHSRGAMWVNILEKTLMMLVSNKDYDLESGGQPIRVMTALLGPAGDGFQQADTAATMLNNLLKYCYRGSKRWTERHQQQAIESILIDGNDYSAFRDWNSELKGTFWQRKEQQKQETLEALREHLKGLHASCVSKIIAFAVGMNCVHTDKRYTRQQRETYALIARAVATQKAVTATTNKELKTGKKGFTEKALGVGGTAGEGRRAGLFDNHAYSVVGVDSRPPEYLGIILRNPHGKSLFDAGRDYRTDKNGNLGKSVSSSNPEFWLELSEFCTDCTFDIAGQAVTQGRQAFMADLKRALDTRGNR